MTRRGKTREILKRNFLGHPLRPRFHFVADVFVRPRTLSDGGSKELLTHKRTVGTIPNHISGDHTSKSSSLR
jgi:hypothetical protein